MKRVLVIHFSQTGQLTRVINSFTAPLFNHSQIEVVTKQLIPTTAYPFPWPFMEFFSFFPETVYMEASPVKALELENTEDFDLIILGYQAWFLSPSLPMTAFLRSAQAERLLKDKPVITVIACRDMWLMAQEKLKKELTRLQAQLIANVALVDKGGSAISFMSTPLWMFTGKKGPWGFVPKAGIAEEDIVDCKRFGTQIAKVLSSPDAVLDETLLQGLGAVTIKEKTIASEIMAHRSFLIWGKLLRAAGGQKSKARRLALCFYITFLIFLILTVVPLSALVKKCLSPFTRKRIAKQKQYYAAPSGESRHLIK